MASLSLELIEKSKSVVNILDTNKEPIQIKIGFHTGLVKSYSLNIQSSEGNFY